MTYAIEIRDAKTDEVVHRVIVGDYRDLDKVEDGLAINLNWDYYYTTQAEGYTSAISGEWVTLDGGVGEDGT